MVDGAHAIWDIYRRLGIVTGAVAKQKDPPKTVYVSLL